MVEIVKEKEANNLSFVCCECGWSGLVNPSLSPSTSAASTTRTPKPTSKPTSNQQSHGSRVQRFLCGLNPLTKAKSKHIQTSESAQTTTMVDFSTQTCSMCNHGCCGSCIKVQLGGHGGANGDVVALMGGGREVADLGVLEHTNAQPGSNQLPLLDHAGHPIVDVPIPVSSMRPARKSSLRAPMTALYPRLQQQAKAQAKLYTQSRVQGTKHVRFLTPPGSALPVQETKSVVVERRRADSGVGVGNEARTEEKKAEGKGKGEVEIGVTMYACAYLPGPSSHLSSQHESESEGMPDSATLPPAVLTFPRAPQRTTHNHNHNHTPPPIDSATKPTYHKLNLLALLSPPPPSPSATASPTSPLFPLFPVSPITPTYSTGGGGRNVTPNRSASTLGAAAATRVLAAKVRRAREPEMRARGACAAGAEHRGAVGGSQGSGESWGRMGY